MDGADWYGRGGVQDITMAATIAAYEHFITEWKSERSEYGMAGKSYFGKGSFPGRGHPETD
jgi:hypothetical protein